MTLLSLNQRGFQQLTVDTTPVGLTMPTDLLPHHALIYVADNPVRWRADVDGTEPSASVGTFVAANSYIDWTVADKNYKSVITQVKFVRDATATGPAKLDVAYFD